MRSLVPLSIFLFNISNVIAADRPNIVLIMADDLGFETIGANGGTSYKTPVLDQMAAEGVRFEHCYSQPICTPSRVKLMTGMYNVRNYAEFGLLEKTQTTFANILSDAGYITCIVGKWQLGKDPTLPKHFGFDEHCLWQLFRRPSRYPNPGLEINGEAKNFREGYGPDVATEYALDFIKRKAAKPFLLYYPMILTHCPFEPTPDSADWDATDPGSKTYKGDAKYFGDMVGYMDKQVGRIIDALETAGVRDNTLLMFTGDNGTDTPVVSMMSDRKVTGAKGTTIDAGTRVPLIVQWPKHHAKATVSGDLVDFSDMLPTMCEAAGIEVPPSLTLDGHSFLPQIKGQVGNPRDWIYVWYARNGGRTGQEFARDQRYKLYRNGNFFDVPNDYREQSPLNAELSEEALAARTKLQKALDKYEEARPEKFGSWAKKKAGKKKATGKNKNAKKSPSN